MSRSFRRSFSVAILLWLGVGVSFSAEPATPSTPRPVPASPLTPEESLQHLQVDPDLPRRVSGCRARCQCPGVDRL